MEPALPNKTQVALDQLVKSKVLTPYDVEILKTAGRISKNPQLLLGFAVTLKSVPYVSDTIKMAEQLGAKINLLWSPDRWRDEHDRLSRAVTLKMLAAENVTYDLPDLPHLIRNSRRLGLEGLRQRHCIASYHNQIKQGLCMIASVVIDHKRWTVELRTVGGQLYLGQVATRFNRPVRPEVLNKIREIYNIPERQTGVPDDNDRIDHEQELRAILPELRALGVTSVEIHFDGSGDSGQIDSISYEPAGVDVPHALSVRLEEITHAYLECTGVDWYNNNGGFGELTIYVTDGTAEMDVNYRVSSSENAYSEELDLNAALS